MKKRREKEIKTMADAIEDAIADNVERQSFAHGEVSPDITRKKTSISDASQIIATKKLEIPKCLATPVNGRMNCIEVKGDDLRSPGGLILPVKLSMKKDDSVESFPRFFVVNWDEDGIPKEIRDKLTVGIEVFPFMPEEAIGYMFPRTIDWNTDNIFKSLHYTELANISQVMPEIVE